jgi:hypothetical protein
MATLLINRLDIAKYKQISSTVYDDVLNAIINDAQIQDLAPLLGEMLFTDILKNPLNYQNLLNEGSYTYNGTTFNNWGLKSVLAHFSYARYIMYGSVIDTPFSAVEKTFNNSSQPATAENKKKLFQMNIDLAYTYWQSVENYLIRTNNNLFKKQPVKTNKMKFKQLWA